MIHAIVIIRSVQETHWFQQVLSHHASLVSSNPKAHPEVHPELILELNLKLNLLLLDFHSRTSVTRKLVCRPALLL